MFWPWLDVWATFTIFSGNRADLPLRARDAYALRGIPEYAYSTGVGIGPFSQVMDRADLLPECLRGLDTDFRLSEQLTAALEAHATVQKAFKRGLGADMAAEQKFPSAGSAFIPTSSIRWIDGKPPI